MPAATANVRAVFLDRDGTILVEKGDVGRVEEVELLPRAVEGLALLKKLGFQLLVCTNQAGVARGKFTEQDVAHVHRHLQTLLRTQGVALDGFFYCPHHPEGAVPSYAVECACRKPQPGLILQAAKERGVDVTQSFLIGDAPRDLLAGRAAGVKTILVKTGFGADLVETQSVPPETSTIADDLLAAAQWIEKSVHKG